MGKSQLILWEVLTDIKMSKKEQIKQILIYEKVDCFPLAANESFLCFFLIYPSHQNIFFCILNTDLITDNGYSRSVVSLSQPTQSQFCYVYFDWVVPWDISIPWRKQNALLHVVFEVVVM